MHIKQVRDALSEGHTTNESISEYLDLDYRHVSRELKRMCDEELLVRWREGHNYCYAEPGSADDPTVERDPVVVTPEPEQPAEVREEHIEAVNEIPEAAASPTVADDGRAPVNRDYDWGSYVPTGVPEYQPTTGSNEQATLSSSLGKSSNELTRILSVIESRHETGNLPRFLIGGPTGCGKTTLAEYIAQENDWPMITIQGRYSMYDVDLLGQSIITGDSTRWVDGPLTKAMLASRDGPVVLLIDEANRARPEAASVLFSALDHRATVTLDERGGERIEGNALNLITFATINEGRGHFVEDIDQAVKRRYGLKFEVDYLGVNSPQSETDLIANRTPLPEEIAKYLVRVANDVRNLAESDDSDVNYGIPTASMLTWANAAYAYHQSGMANAVVEAARDTIVTPLYDSQNERNTVMNTVRTRLEGAPVDPESARAWDDEGGMAPDEAELQCRDCGWTTAASSNDENLRDARDTHMCPACSGTLEFTN